MGIVRAVNNFKAIFTLKEAVSTRGDSHIVKIGFEVSIEIVHQTLKHEQLDSDVFWHWFGKTELFAAFELESGFIREDFVFFKVFFVEFKDFGVGLALF